MGDAGTDISWLSELSGITEGEVMSHRWRPFHRLYWTLPVFWAGFRSLPTDVEAASAKNWTIRYQRARVREWAKDEAVQLIDEMVYIDVHAKFGTDAVLETLERARAICTARRAKILYVDFKKLNGWRPHKHLSKFVEEHNFAVPVPPKPVTIDGKRHEPALHFTYWKQLDKSEAEKRRRKIARTFEKQIAQFPDGTDRNALIAKSLNEQHILTKRGRSWTPDNVRVALYRALPTQQAE